jgi:hypothetical protein
MTTWGALAIWYSNLSESYVRTGLAGLYVLATFLAFIFLSRRRRTLAGFLVVFASIVVWWLSIPASNDRNWQADVAVLPYAAVKGEQITIYNIRNLNYRTETDYDVRYYDKTFDLNRLDSVDLIAVYWMGDAIAHIMLSFGFQGKDFVNFSIETRKEVGEEYSTLKGFFKQYELIFIVGDERDLIRVRTDYRKPPEDVYLYRGSDAGELPEILHGVCPPDQLHEGKSRMVQHAHHELHHGRGAAHPRLWRSGSIQLEGAAFRLCPAVCVRKRIAGYAHPLRRAPETQLHQFQSPGRRRRSGVLAQDTRESAATAIELVATAAMVTT